VLGTPRGRGGQSGGRLRVRVCSKHRPRTSAGRQVTSGVTSESYAPSMASDPAERSGKTSPDPGNGARATLARHPLSSCPPWQPSCAQSSETGLLARGGGTRGAGLHLVLAPRAAAEAGADVLRLLRALVLMAVPELSAMRREDAELVDVVRTVPGPRRTLMRACRNGQIAGAARVGRRWLASRAAVEAWLRAHGPRLVSVAGEEDADDLDYLRSALAVPYRPAKRRRNGSPCGG
jgi:hypothetical protein